MIDITMIGIDHDKASIDERELFSFTVLQVENILKQWKKANESTGALLISTCNRTEIWISGRYAKEELLDLLCQSKGLDGSKYGELFIYRDGSDAVNHLLKLTCGLKSMIRGEDQILSQVREALEVSRDCNASDTLIERLFQTAISAGKKVKTQVKIAYSDPSLAQNSLDLIEEKFGSAKDVSCLIIGNGQMGQLAAEILSSAGTDVSMTLRKQFHGKTEESSAQISGCTMIAYDDRIKNIEDYQVVISATRSPHHTIKVEDLRGKIFKDSLWIDMALPRDIEPEINNIEGIQLLDMDELGGYQTSDESSYAEAEEILTEHEKDFEQWYNFRRYVDMVKNISTLVKEDVSTRTSKNINQLEEPEVIQDMLDESIKKSMEKLLFGLKDTLSAEQWQECLVALEQSARRDTIKT